MALVLWSGGCDSTLALYQLLKKHSEDQTGWVHTISLMHSNVPAPHENRQARNRLLAKFKAQRLPICHTEIMTTYKGYRQAEKGDGLIQPLIWLTTAISYLKENEDLYTGYIATDQVWHYKPQLLTACDSLLSIAGKTGKIKHPLEWYTKEEVIKELAEANLLDSCWSCEFPKKIKRKSIPCGDCVPCKTHQKGMWAYEKWLKPKKLSP